MGGANVTGVRRKVDDGGSAPLILLVDDVEDTRGLYASHLSSAGFRVEQAVDGEHALLKAMSRLPDVVVMDLVMPVLDGWEATHQLKSNPRTKHIPVIALTGHMTKRDLRLAEDAGADVVLAKPCTPETLHVVIDRLLGMRRAGGQR